MKKVSELEGAELDAAVAKALGGKITIDGFDYEIREINGRQMVQPAISYSDNGEDWRPCLMWAQGGPIVEQNWQAIRCALERMIDPYWPASIQLSSPGNTLPTFMRAYVASKLGEEIEL